MYNNIIEPIVESDKCIGCGVCSSICPIDILTMKINNEGMYQPYESDGCLTKCNLCLNVCPFMDDENYKISEKLYLNEKTKFHKYLGYFYSTYEIYDKNDKNRLLSASGGGGYQILKHLLEKEYVDKVVTIVPNNDKDKLFKFSIFDEINQLNKTRGSIYYPTELSQVLNYIKNNDGKYVITALPCYAKAIRLAQEKNPKLRKRIKFVVGLVCGQMKSKKFTEELGLIATKSSSIEEVNFRIKKEGNDSSNFLFKFKSTEGTIGFLERKKEPNDFWSTRTFTPMACNSCTDVFAYNADIILMDGWLPEYKKDYKGHTLTIIRSKELDEIIQNNKEIHIKQINPSKIYNSQKGVVESKISIAKGSLNPLITLINKIKVKIQKLSNENYYKNKIKINSLISLLRKVEKINNLIKLPIRIIRKIKNKIGK